MTGLAITGAATAEEVAAVVAALQTRVGAHAGAEDRYEDWRRARIAACRRGPTGDQEGLHDR